jgi:hypothetical protein
VWSGCGHAGLLAFWVLGGPGSHSLQLTGLIVFPVQFSERTIQPNLKSELENVFWFSKHWKLSTEYWKLPNPQLASFESHSQLEFRFPDRDNTALFNRTSISTDRNSVIVCGVHGPGYRPENPGHGRLVADDLELKIRSILRIGIAKPMSEDGLAELDGSRELGFLTGRRGLQNDHTR